VPEGHRRRLNDLQSLYVANNVCSAVEYFRKLGGNVGVAGMVINKDDGTGEAQAFAEAAGIPVLAAIPANEDIRRKSANYEIIGPPGGEWGPLFAELAPTSPTRRRCARSPLTQDGLLGLFKRRDTLAATSCSSRPPSSRHVRRRHRRSKPSLEVVYDTSDEPGKHGQISMTHLWTSNEAIGTLRRVEPAAARCGVDLAKTKADGLGCHAGKDEMMRAPRRRQERDARAVRRRLSAGPHDQPQSMCPAFGSLRVGLRMRRTATVLSGSACCVYGLTFTSHFYGARRTVGYVPFNSETLVTGKLFEDIRERSTSSPTRRSTTRSSSSTSACRPPPACRCSCCRRRSTACASSASTCRASACRPMPRPRTCSPARCCATRATEAEQGPVQAPRGGASDKPTVTLLGEMFPADPVIIGHDARAARPRRRPVVPTREWRELYARSTAPPSPPSTRSTPPHPRVRSRRPPIVGSAPVGHDGTAAWLDAIGEACGVAPTRSTPQEPCCPPSAARSPASRSRAASRCRATKAPSCSSPACSSRAAPTCAMSAPPARAPLVDPDREWLEAKGVHVQFRASLEQDLAAIAEFKPDLAIGTTPVVQKAKESATPALYFTNLISARPLMGPAGAGSLAQVVNAAMAARRRFDEMKGFFGGVGRGTPAGVWEETPRDHPSSASSTSAGRPPGQGARPRRWADARPRSRPGGRLLGRGLRLHRHQGPAGHHRRPGGLREPAGHLGAALHRRAAAARTADRRHGPLRRGARPARHRRRDAPRAPTLDPTCRAWSSPARSPR
jgi:3,8-divinyl chlorophyllide a/chlorophyllide a reductase subunit Y